MLAIEGEHDQACEGEHDQGQTFTTKLGRGRERASREERYQHAHLCLRPLVQGGTRRGGRGTGGDEWLLLLHEMGVLSVGASGSCKACFIEGGDKEGVGQGWYDWISASLCEIGSLSLGLYG